MVGGAVGSTATAVGWVRQLSPGRACPTLRLRVRSPWRQGSTHDPTAAAGAPTCAKRAAALGLGSTSGWQASAARLKAALTSSLRGGSSGSSGSGGYMGLGRVRPACSSSGTAQRGRFQPPGACCLQAGRMEC